VVVHRPGAWRKRAGAACKRTTRRTFFAGGLAALLVLSFGDVGWASADTELAPANETARAPSGTELTPDRRSQPRTGAGLFVTFERPRFWRESTSETWTLVNRAGVLLCELPCSRTVLPGSDYAIQGVGVSGISAKPLGPVHLSLPEVVPPRVFAELQSSYEPGTSVLARIHPERGSPVGAMILAAVSGVVLVSGVVFAVVGFSSTCYDEGCVGKALVGFGGLIIGGIGLLGEVGALAWADYSRRPWIDFTPVMGGKRLVSKTGLHLNLFPTTLGGNF
jgi:hypothetical protein